ncbi:hypothetical protein DVH24_032598 [Malus domestica]|uniref:Uncharacterized protein n=1 Tax=Malus domestica TaxID=3750 RepID=A0A498JA13_MALDO|nr:hypothetical protein DVH24_032598 [Malus domestica]
MAHTIAWANLGLTHPSDIDAPKFDGFVSVKIRSLYVGNLDHWSKKLVPCHFENFGSLEAEIGCLLDTMSSYLISDWNGYNLSTPKTEKFSKDCENGCVRYGLLSMQGWRTTTEDAMSALNFSLPI